MKYTFTLFLTLSLLTLSVSFVPNPCSGVVATTSTTRVKHVVTPLATHKNVLHEIAHELHEELGQPDPVARHLSEHAHALERHESKVHRLRRALVEKDQAYHALLDELQEQETHRTNVQHLETVLTKICNEVHHQNDLLSRKKEISQQQLDTLHMLAVQVTQLQSTLSLPTSDVTITKSEHRTSIRSLMWQILQTIGRRIKKLPGRILWWRA
jgi:chromosome segregation ATPase